MSGENDIYGDEDLDAVGVRPPQHVTVVDAEGTRRVPVPQRVADPRATGPGQMAPGSTVVSGPSNGRGGIDTTLVPVIDPKTGEQVGWKRIPAGAYVPVGSKECPVDPRAGNVGESGVKAAVDANSVGKDEFGRRGGTPVHQFPYNPFDPANHGTLQSREIEPTPAIVAWIQSGGDLEKASGWLYRVTTGLRDMPDGTLAKMAHRRRPPYAVVVALMRRQDGAPLVAWCRQTNQTLDAWARAGEPVLAE